MVSSIYKSWTLCIFCSSLFVLHCARGGGEATSTTTTISSTLTGDGALTATAPSSLSVVPTSLSNSISGQVQAIRSALSQLPDTGSTDYDNDTTETWSMDPTKERFAKVDRMLKMLDKIGYEYVYNKGAVKAVFDKNELEKGSGGGASKGAGSSNQKQMVEMTLSSTLAADNKMPLTVEAWGEFKDKSWGQDLKTSYQFKVIISEAPSESNRFGVFEIWQNVTISYSASDSFSEGNYFKATSEGELLKLVIVETYSNQYDDGSGNSQVWSGKFWSAAEVNDAAQTGAILLGEYNPQNPCSTSGFIKYDPNYVYQIFNWSYPSDYNDTSGGCTTSSYETAFNRKNITRNIWSYGLYDKATKNRKTLNMGMMVESLDGTCQGWADDYGLYMYPTEPDSDGVTWSTCTVSDGTQVREVAFDGSTGSTFTISGNKISVFENGGSSNNYSYQKISTLSGDLKLVDYNTIRQDCEDATGSYTPDYTNATYLIKSSDFKLYICTDNSCSSSSAATNATSLYGLVPDSQKHTTDITDSSSCYTDLDSYSAGGYTYDINFSKQLIKADSTSLQFDEPLKFTVTDSNSKVHTITYYGFGMLDVPWDDVASTGNYAPVVNLNSGSELIYNNAGTNETYLVKQLMVGEEMEVLDIDSSSPDRTANLALLGSLTSAPSMESLDVTAIPALEASAVPSATKICVVDGKPVDGNGAQLRSITGDNAAKFCQ